MKRLIKLLIGTVFSLALLSCLLPGTEAAAISGSGTAESPYVITSAAELQAVNDDLDAYYVLGNNISLSGQSFEPLGNEWDGPFTGTSGRQGLYCLLSDRQPNRLEVCRAVRLYGGHGSEPEAR